MGSIVSHQSSSVTGALDASFVPDYPSVLDPRMRTGQVERISRPGGAFGRSAVIWSSRCCSWPGTELETAAFLV